MTRISGRQKYEIQNLMTKVLCGEVICLNKAYLLKLLGRERDRSEAWSELLDIYEDIGGSRDSLYGVELNGNIVVSPSAFDQVRAWSGEEDDDDN